MKFVKRIENVNQVVVFQNIIIYALYSEFKSGLLANANEIWSFENGSFNLLRRGYIYYLTVLADGLIYNTNSGEPIYYFDFDNERRILEKGYYFKALKERYDNDEIIISKMDENFNSSHFLYTLDKVHRSIPKFMHEANQNYFFYFSKKTNEIECYKRNSFDIHWNRADFTNYGRFQLIDKKTGKPYHDKPNGFRLEKPPFADEKALYVPLQGGQLLAVDIDTGKDRWFSDNHQEVYVSYGINGDKIYRNHGDGFKVMSKYTGEILLTKSFKDIDGLEEFHATGRVWCFDDIIVLRSNLSYARIAVLDIETVTLKGYYEITNTKVAESADVIVYNGKYLCVLDIMHHLHILEFDA